MTVSSAAVVTRFEDGSSAFCDIPKGDNGYYQDVARRCGYGDNWKLYAQHHDVMHVLLAWHLWGKPSPALWAVAHDAPPPVDNDVEEWLANTFAWILMTGNRGYHSEYLSAEFPGWGAALHSIEKALLEVGLLPQSAH